MEYYQKAAEKDNADAYYSIGRLYENGYGVEQNYEKALEYYQKAADHNLCAAFNQIGWYYNNGYGVEKDYEKAMEYYEKALKVYTSKFGEENPNSELVRITIDFLKARLN
jgi:TPR repeat protein